MAFTGGVGLGVCVGVLSGRVKLYEDCVTVIVIMAHEKFML